MDEQEFAEEAISHLHARPYSIRAQRHAPMALNHLRGRLINGSEEAVLEISTFVLANGHPSETASFRYPDGPWQAFKEKYFPARLLRRLPVRWKKITLEAKREVRICPHLNLKLEQQNAYHFYFLMGGVEISRL